MPQADLNEKSVAEYQPHISVVIPVFNAESILGELCSRLNASLERITPDYEFILVEDGGPDRSWAEIKKLAAADCRIKGFKLSRNFGQHYAITAGLDACVGDWIVVMDCDLQDRPEEIPRLYRKALEGYDVVLARRAIRQDKKLKRFWSYLFSEIFGRLSGQRGDSAVSNFGIYHKKVIHSYRRMRESVRVFAIFVRWLGFATTSVDVEHGARQVGTSNYTFRKSLDLAFSAILAHSNKPLYFSIKFGFLLSAASIVWAIYLIMRYFLYSMTVPGWTSVIVSIYMLAGLFFVNTGILGVYIGRIYDETKARPLYVIAESTQDFK